MTGPRQRTVQRVVCVALLLVSLAAPAGADPITVNAGQMVTVTFGTNPSAWDPADPPDYLDFYLGVGTSAWLDGAQPVDVALYDGDRLLGSRSGMGVGAVFQGAGLEVRRDWATYALNAIDFTSLLDGTIDGRLELSPTAGAFVFDPALGLHWLLLMDVQPTVWAAASGEFAWLRNVSVGVTPVLTPVPEPGSLVLVATGLGVGWLRFRNRRKRRQEDFPAR